MLLFSVDDPDCPSEDIDDNPPPTPESYDAAAAAAAAWPGSIRLLIENGYGANAPVFAPNDPKFDDVLPKCDGRSKGELKRINCFNCLLQYIF